MLNKKIYNAWSSPLAPGDVKSAVFTHGCSVFSLKNTLIWSNPAFVLLSWRNIQLILWYARLHASCMRLKLQVISTYNRPIESQNMAFWHLQIMFHAWNLHFCVLLVSYCVKIPASALFFFFFKPEKQQQEVGLASVCW